MNKRNQWISIYKLLWLWNVRPYLVKSIYDIRLKWTAVWLLKATILYFSLIVFVFSEINNFEMNINVGENIVRTVFKCTTGLIIVKW